VHETGCLAFVHIPKNGGTTITDQLKLQRNFMGNSVLGSLNPRFNKHDTAAIIRIMLKDLFPNPILFATIRHPYKRTFSMWRQMIEVNSKYLLLPDIPHKDYSSDIIKQYGNGVDGFARFIEEKPPWAYHPKNGSNPDEMLYDGWWPQAKWICDKNNKLIVDRIFDVKDLKALEDWIARYNVRFLSHLHTNVRQDYDSKIFLTKDIKKKIDKVFEQDFNMFNFAEEL